MAKEVTIVDLEKKIRDLEETNRQLQNHINIMKRAMKKMETALHELTVSTKADINTIRTKLRSS